MWHWFSFYILSTIFLTFTWAHGCLGQWEWRYVLHKVKRSRLFSKHYLLKFLMWRSSVWFHSWGLHLEKEIYQLYLPISITPLPVVHACMLLCVFVCVCCCLWEWTEILWRGKGRKGLPQKSVLCSRETNALLWQALSTWFGTKKWGKHQASFYFWEWFLL